MKTKNDVLNAYKDYCAEEFMRDEDHEDISDIGLAHTNIYLDSEKESDKELFESGGWFHMQVSFDLEALTIMYQNCQGTFKKIKCNDYEDLYNYILMCDFGSWMHYWLDYAKEASGLNLC